MTAENQIPEPAGPATIYRILDANRNRCLEGLRVVEEHVRFIWEDQHLVAQCKQLRHDLVTVLASLPRAVRWVLTLTPRRFRTVDLPRGGNLTSPIGEQIRASSRVIARRQSELSKYGQSP